MPRSKYFRSISRYGRISLSLINFQMMRVISSPSISTTGFFTLIFGIAGGLYHAERRASSSAAPTTSASASHPAAPVVVEQPPESAVSCELFEPESSALASHVERVTSRWVVDSIHDTTR